MRQNVNNNWCRVGPAASAGGDGGGGVQFQLVQILEFMCSSNRGGSDWDRYYSDKFHGPPSSTLLQDEVIIIFVSTCCLLCGLGGELEREQTGDEWEKSVNALLGFYFPGSHLCIINGLPITWYCLLWCIYGLWLWEASACPYPVVGIFSIVGIIHDLSANLHMNTFNSAVHSVSAWWSRITG